MWLYALAIVIALLVAHRMLPEVPSDVNNPMGNPEPFPTIHEFVSRNRKYSVRELYDKDINRPIEDYFMTRDAFRNFYALPPHSREEYQDFVYGRMPSCKTNQEDCFPTERQII